jgi:hypothetical protein
MYSDDEFIGVMVEKLLAVASKLQPGPARDAVMGLANECLDQMDPPPEPPRLAGHSAAPAECQVGRAG